MSLSETKIIKQITVLPEAGAVQVQWANQIKRGTEVISETFERKAYSADMTGFNKEVGSLNVNAFMTAFNVASMEAKVDAEQALAAAQGALTAAQTELAAAQNENASLQTQLEAKDAIIADLQAQLSPD